MTPLLSIVSGTYQRLQYLKLMVLSVRSQLPKGIDYEIILVDGGSTDSTLEWARQQPDIRLIEDGALLGAISAFSRGAEVAQGDYVVLANDDVTFHPYSLLTALAYLERTPHCGAVAFADNRSALFTTGDHFRTEGIGVTLPDGTKTMLTYAQVGMYRKALGDEALWWGYRDPVMGQSKTYGGDSFLSARLYEMGYSVDAVDGCAVTEMVLKRNPDGTVTGDALHHSHASDGGFYYERFPTVHIPAVQQQYPIPERLRFLYLPVYEPNFPQAANTDAGLTEAFGDYGVCLEVDYLNAPKLDLPRLVKAWQPDLILTQMQGWGEKLTPQMLADMRQNAPQAVVVNWNGDAHERGLVDSRMFDLLAHVDLQLTVNAKVLPVYQHAHVAANYWQIYYRPSNAPLPQVPAHDVLYQANWYEYRKDLFDVLYSLRSHGYNVGVYGNDRRANGSTHYDFAAQAALYAHAKINVGDTFPNTEGFISNRVLQCLGAGGFLLLQYSPQLERWTGLQDGVHYVMWSDLTDLVTKIAEWSASERDAQRQQIAQQGQAFVREHFNAQAQVRKLLTELLPALEEKEYA